MSNTMKMILENLIPIVVTVLTPILLVLVRDLIKMAAKKWHMDAVLAYEGKVEELVMMGIAAAEKSSLNAVKSGKPATPGEEKLASVIQFVNSELAQHNLSQKGGDALAKMVDAKLSPYITVVVPPVIPPADPVVEVAAPVVDPFVVK